MVLHSLPLVQANKLLYRAGCSFGFLYFGTGNTELCYPERVNGDAGVKSARRIHVPADPTFLRRPGGFRAGHTDDRARRAMQAKIDRDGRVTAVNRGGVHKLTNLSGYSAEIINVTKVQLC
jgi:hypothetical protein